VAARRRSKFGAIKTVVDGVTFDSKGEAERYKDLKHLEKAGDIRDLKLQVAYELVPAVILNGRKKPAMKYIADYVYFDVRKDKEIVEDFKGVRTAIFIAKKHLMKWRHNIEILESTSKNSRQI
jgi:hypothetical protein